MFLRLKGKCEISSNQQIYRLSIIGLEDKGKGGLVGEGSRHFWYLIYFLVSKKNKEQE